MTRMGQMVNFPLLDNQWEDSGEGGLFVMMVVPRPDGWSHDYCHIDVVADIRLSRADCNVSVEAANDLWEPWEFRRSDRDKQDKTFDLLKKAGEGELASWSMRARNWDEFSVSMLASIHMGSTGHALFKRRTRETWEAGPGDLTEHGQAIRSAMAAAFGIEPILLTFLDT